MLTDTKVAAIKPPKAGQEEHRDHKVTGLRLRVGTTGKKTWTLRARAGDKVVNKKLGTYPTMGLGAARIAAERLLETIARDGSTEAAERTFGAVADAWIEKKRADKKHNKSVELQRRRLELHVLPKWRDRKIADIRRRDVRDLIEGIEGDVLPNRVLTTVRTVFRYALSRDWIEASPAEGIEKPKDETERDRFLDMDEAKRVWDSAGLLGYPYAPFVRLLLLTGQRRTEVASMRWSDLDLDTGRWTMKAGDTKSDRAHMVPLSGPVVELLKPLPQLGDYVLSTDGETHIKGYAKAKARLDAFIAAKGGEMAPWTFHDLRRTVATHLVRLGVPMEIVARVLNHAKAGVTAKVYALHEYEPEKRSALDRWAADVMRTVDGTAARKVVPIRG
jgi:integrase